MLKIGNTAPDFALASSSGEVTGLKSLRGRKVVLYFYPKDMTPGCTQEACDFRDNMARLTGRGVAVLGVSSDSPASHTKFKDKYSLPFELLSDPEFAVTKIYGAYGSKLLYGQKVTGTIRTTYLIDERGKIAALWSPVKVEGHVDEVLTAIRELDLNGSPPRSRPRPGSIARSAGSRPKSARSRRMIGADPAH